MRGHTARLLATRGCVAGSTRHALQPRRCKSGTWMEGKMGLDTETVHAAVSPEPSTGAILTPLFLSTTFVQ